MNNIFNITFTNLFKSFLRKSICLLFIVFSFLLTEAQDITGIWNGVFHIQPKELPIIFHIGRDSSGILIATFDSPGQNAFNLPVTTVLTKGDSVILMLAIINGKYAGVLGPDKKTITGTWFQGPGAMPLTVTKTSDNAVVKQKRRPQTPKPPFSYQSTDVEYWNADKSIHYGATLTYPKPVSSTDRPHSGKKGFPAVILITGSGQQDRDEMMLEHRPFAVIADNLTKKGFAVLRVDDRGIGGTTGDFSQATSLDFVKDVEAGIDFLETRPEINKDNIGLIGHSEGGLIAPIVAVERKEVKFIILLAGPGIPTIDVMELQSEAIAVSSGKSVAEARVGSRFMRVGMEEIQKSQDTAIVFKNIKSRVGSWAKTQDSAALAKIRSRSTLSMDDQIRQLVAAMNSKWYRYFITYDPRPYLEKLHCKVLALNGSKDVQMIPAPNLAGIRSCLQKSHSPKYDVIELPGLNHLFQTCTRCNLAEYDELEETFSPTALTAMDDWLAKNVQ